MFAKVTTVVALVAMLGSASAMLQDEIRDCTRRTCVTAGAADTLELSCGGNGDTITSVKFASFGLPTGGCPAEDDSLFSQSQVNLTKTSTCDADFSVEVITDKCIGEEECSIDVAATFPTSDPGLVGCVGSFSTFEYKVQVECGSSFDVFNLLISAVIAFVALGMGATIDSDQVRVIFKKHKRAFIIGAGLQFLVMPLIMFAFAKGFKVSALVGISMIITGACPGGTTSNLFTYFAKGSVALSIIMSAFSTVCALFMIPLLVLIYGEYGLGFDDGELKVPFTDIFLALLIAIVPASLGFLIRRKSVKWALRVEKIGSVLGVLFILAALVIGVLDNPDLFNPSVFPVTWISAILFQPLGFIVALFVARLSKLPGPELRAVCLEVSVQNYTIAIAVISLSFEGCDRRIALGFPLVATFFYLVNSLWITISLRWSAKFDSDEDRDELNKDAAIVGEVDYL